MEQIKVGTVIYDNGKFGLITNIIQNGVLKESQPVTFVKTYEIRYFDGLIAFLSEKQMQRLIDNGKIEVIAR